MIAIRTATRSRRRAALLTGIVGLLIAATLWAHGGPGTDHMGGSDHMSMGGAKTMCLAIFEVAGSLLVLAALLRRRPRPAATLGVVHGIRLGLEPPRDPGPARARAGPARLQVFRL